MHGQSDLVVCPSLLVKLEDVDDLDVRAMLEGDELIRHFRPFSDRVWVVPGRISAVAANVGGVLTVFDKWNAGPVFRFNPSKPKAVPPWIAPSAVDPAKVVSARDRDSLPDRVFRATFPREFPKRVEYPIRFYVLA